LETTQGFLTKEAFFFFFFSFVAEDYFPFIFPFFFLY